MNILILSCGIRNKIIQYFKKELSGKGLIMAADCSRLAPALYEADKHFIVPRFDDKAYLGAILNICRENDIKAVLSLVDPELSILAANKQLFLNAGTLPVVSDFDVVEMCFDKYSMYKFLVENGFRTARSYIDKEEFYSDIDAGKISYPVFMKPVTGSGSVNVQKAASREELEVFFNRNKDMLIQEFMDGLDYDADTYIDLISGEPVAIFIKEKISMRAGEASKSVSVKDPILFALIGSFVKKAGLKGIVDIDIFKVKGKYYISEVNPRIGGNFPHAYESGVNMLGMLVRNLEGYSNNEVIGKYCEDIYMLKYNEVCIIKEGID